MKVVMNLTDLAVVAFALGGGVMGLVMLGLWALADIGPPDSEDRYPHVFTQPRPKAALRAQHVSEKRKLAKDCRPRSTVERYGCNAIPGS